MHPLIIIVLCIISFCLGAVVAMAPTPILRDPVGYDEDEDADNRE